MIGFMLFICVVAVGYAVVKGKEKTQSEFIPVDEENLHIAHDINHNTGCNGLLGDDDDILFSHEDDNGVSAMNDSDLFDSDPIEVRNGFDDNDINPATGLPMIGGIGGIDVGGDVYGSSFSHDSMFDSSFDDSIGSSFDDSFGSGIDDPFNDNF